MRYLQSLASEHRIEVVNGCIERTYQLPEESSITRCLSTMCEKWYDGETLWIQLIKFLEKDLQVQQQEVLIQGKKLSYIKQYKWQRK